MTNRHALRLLLAAITLAAAGASVALGAFWIAGGMLGCVLATAAQPLSKKVSADQVRMFLESLRASQLARAPAMNAVVGVKMIFVGKPAIYGESTRGNLLLFRDEIDAPVWREIATLLTTPPIGA